MSCNLDARSSNSYSFTGPNVHSTSIYLGKYCSCLTLITQSYVLLFLHTQVTKFLILRPKLKKLFVSRTRLTVRRRCNSKYFFAWFATNFFFFFGFRYCSRIYVQNWFTLLNEQNPLLDFEGTRFVNEKKKKSNYLLTHRWNGGSGAGNEHIFKGGLKCFFNFLLHWNVSLAMWSLNFQIQILYWYSKNYPIRSSFTLTQSSR